MVGISTQVPAGGRTLMPFTGMVVVNGGGGDTISALNGGSGPVAVGYVDVQTLAGPRLTSTPQILYYNINPSERAPPRGHHQTPAWLAGSQSAAVPHALAAAAPCARAAPRRGPYKGRRQLLQAGAWRAAARALPRLLPCAPCLVPRRPPQMLKAPRTGARQL